jgi:hypothetical protein
MEVMKAAQSGKLLRDLRGLLKRGVPANTIVARAEIFMRAPPAQKVKCDARYIAI